MKFSKLKFFLGGLCALVLTGALLSCVVDDKDDDKDDTTEFSVKVTSESTEIASSGSVDLSAVVTVVSAKNNSPEIKWEITSGSEYAELSATSGEKVKLTGKNTTAENKIVTVKATATVDGIAKTAVATITVTGTGSSSGGEGGGTGGSGESGGTGGSGGGSESGETILWRADDYTAETISETKVLGNMTVLASSSKQVTIASSSITVEGYSFTKVLKFGGSGSKTGRALKFTLTETSELEVYCVSASNSGTGRMLVLATDSAEINKTNEAPTTAGILNYGSIEAGTYYLYSNNSGINIYAVKITTAGTGSGGSSSGGTGGSGGSESGGSGSGESGGETGSNVISKNDTPTGFANIDVSKFTTEKTVTTAAELISYAKKGGYLIYVSGEIDISEGKLPSSAGGTTSALDSFVSSKSSYSTYEAFKTAYAAACSADTNDKSSSSPGSSLGSVLWTLNKAYGELIKINVASNTAIIGLNGAVVKGGTFQISSADNVVIRNLTIKDAYDPFPHHEKGDGFNAQWDNVSVTTSTNVWIDHCTFEDTMLYSKVTISDGTTQEKWQTYDGLCDITKTSKNVVVSYCEFKNHDKTMLIGSSDTDVSGGSITIHHNRFLNCGQRLPMTCWANMHIYNNYYERDSNAYYSQQACIAARYSAYTIIAENNYFGSGITKAITPSTSPSGSCYIDGNYFAAGNSACTLTTTSTKPFTPTYSYTPDAAADLLTLIPENAGAGVWNVVQ